MQSTNRKEDLALIQNPTPSEDPPGGATFNNIKTAVAEKLHSAAAAIRQKSGENRTAHQASDWLNHAADYVRDIEPAQIKSDLQQQVRSNPGRSLLIAGAAGLALGILLRRR